MYFSDKDGRDPVSTLALPSKKKHPEYYTVIENPTDFQIIEKNIFSGAYADLEAFDKDMNTLFKNAEVGKYKSTEVTVKNFMLSFIFEFCIPYTKFFSASFFFRKSEPRTVYKINANQIFTIS